MIRSLLIFCFTLLSVSSSFAQHSLMPKEGQFPRKPGLIISTNILSLVEPEGGPTIGLEYRASLHWAVAVDATALLYTMPDWYRHDDRHTGYRFQPQVKYYISGRHCRYNLYFSLMGMYKHVDYGRFTDGYLDHDSESGEYVYVEGIRYPRKKDVVAGSANFGIQQYLGSERKMILEFYGGLGLRYQDRRGVPSLFESEDYDAAGISDGYFPHFTLGIKFGYRF